MAEEADELDFFTHLVAKQAAKEMKELQDLPASDARNNLVAALIKEIKERGSDMTPLDLMKYSDLGLPIESVLFAGFIKGVAMPALDLAEATTEPLGKLGVCLLVDSQLFAFHDLVTGAVYLPDENRVREMASDGARFIVMVGSCLKELGNWKGATHATKDKDGVVTVSVEGAWYGAPAENVHAQFVRYTLADSQLIYGDIKKLERVAFDREMREAMGKV